MIQTVGQPRVMAMTPEDLKKAQERVMQFVGVIRKTPEISHDGLIGEMVKLGASKIDAELLAIFVPSAFGWVLLGQLGVTNLPTTFIASNAAGKDVEIVAAAQPFFATALIVASGIFRTGYTPDISQRVYLSVLSRSAEADCVRQATEAGASFKGASVKPNRIFGLTAEEICGTANGG